MVSTHIAAVREALTVDAVGGVLAVLAIDHVCPLSAALRVAAGYHARPTAAMLILRIFGRHRAVKGRIVTTVCQRRCNRSLI